MTEYALAPNRKFTADSPYRTPRTMLEQNLLTAYRVRGNGTMRHLDLAPVGSTLRGTAEYVSDAVEYDGRSVQSVARELHISVATVRRYLESLELTEEIEAGEWDDLTFGADGEPVFVASSGEENEETAQGDPVVEEILDQLAGMGKSTDQVLAELEATKAAQAAPRTRRTLAQRRLSAVEQSEERHAERTLADTVAAGAQRQATNPQGRDLHVCGCDAGGPGLHAPGAPNCTAAPVARRPRSHG